ncbi:MAG: ABC transporter permease [Bacilli bacterium]
MYSEEHKLYLNKIRKSNKLVKFTQLFIVLFFIMIWQLSANYNVINTFILSSPKMIFECLINLISHDLFNHILVTVYETLISFILGTIIGIIIAGLLWINKFLSKVMDPFLTILNSLPKVALGPILIIWTGANINSIILMALLISVFTTIITVLQAFNNTDKYMLKLMKSFGCNKLKIFFNLVLPYNFNIIISSLKINISMSLVGVIMGEMLVSKKGLGYLIVYGSQVFNLSLIISSILVLCVISTILYYIVLYIEKRLVINN